MTKPFTKGLAALAISALAIAPVAIGTTLISADPAFAGPGKSAEKGGARGKSAERGAGGEQHASAGNKAGGMGKSNGKGAVASELKGLNAAHAVANGNPQAAPHSQVGRIVTYQREAIETKEAYDAWIAAYEEYEEFVEAYEGRSSTEVQGDLDALNAANKAIQDQIDALDPETDADAIADLEGQLQDTSALEAELAAAKAFEAEANELAQISNDLNEIYEDELEEEEIALDKASGGRDLSDEALAALREKLGL